MEFLTAHQNEIGFIVAAILGGVAHWLKSFVKGQTTDGLIAYYIQKHVATIVYTSIIFAMAIVGAIATGLVTTQMTIWAAIYAGFTTGFTIDSLGSSNNPVSDALSEASKDTK